MKKEKIYSLVVLSMFVIGMVILAPSAAVEAEDIPTISRSETIDIIEEIGYTVPFDATVQKREDTIRGEFWDISWQDDNGIYKFYIDIYTGEAVWILTPPKSYEIVINTESEAISATLDHMDRLQKFSVITLPEEIGVEKPEVHDEPSWVSRGWRIRWDQKIQGIRVAGGFVTVDIASSGELVSYRNSWRDIDESKLCFDELINEEQAIQAAEEWARSERSNRFMDVASVETVDMLIGIPSEHPFIEREIIEEPIIFYRIYFEKDGHGLRVDLDAETEEVVSMDQTRSWPEEYYDHDVEESGTWNSELLKYIGLLVVGFIIGMAAILLTTKYSRHERE